MLADQIAELGDAHHHPVVLLHEALDGQLGIAVFVTEEGGKAALVVEQQAVLGPSGEHVQAIAHLPEKLLGGGQQAMFAFGNEPLVDHGLQVEGAELATRDPEDGLDVAQTAGGTLDVGLQVVLGVVVLGMTSALLVALGKEELLARPHLLGTGDLQHGLAQALRTGDRAAFHQVGDDGEVGTRLIGTLGHRTYSLADL